MPKGKKPMASPVLTGGIRLVRRHIQTGVVSDRKRGRPHPDFEYGYTRDGGLINFKAGNPKPKTRRAKPEAKQMTAAISLGAELHEAVEREIDKRVQQRLAKAKGAAIKAFEEVLRSF